MLVDQKCQECGKKILVRSTDIKRGYGKFCSKQCSCISNGKKRTAALIPNTTCDYCGSMFYRGTSKKTISKSGLQFCCRKCKDMAQKIDSGFKAIHPSHYGKHANYRNKALSNQPNKCNRCGYDIIHVLVVHHKDRDRSNNNISNLEILCRNCHYIVHIEDGYSIP